MKMFQNEDIAYNPNMAGWNKQGYTVTMTNLFTIYVQHVV